MSVLQLALSWTSICQLLALLAAAPVALLTFWTAKLLVRHAWYTHRMACFSKPHAHSWLLGHLGQVTLRQMEVSQFLICKTMYRMCCVLKLWLRRIETNFIITAQLTCVQKGDKTF